MNNVKCFSVYNIKKILPQTLILGENKLINFNVKIWARNFSCNCIDDSFMDNIFVSNCTPYITNINNTFTENCESNSLICNPLTPFTRHNQRRWRKAGVKVRSRQQDIRYTVVNISSVPSKC